MGDVTKVECQQRELDISKIRLPMGRNGGTLYVPLQALLIFAGLLVYFGGEVLRMREASANGSADQMVQERIAQYQESVIEALDRSATAQEKQSTELQRQTILMQQQLTQLQEIDRSLEEHRRQSREGHGDRGGG